MVGGALIEVCGSVIFGLTRSVAEHYDPNGVEFDPGTFGFYLLESTGLEWNSHPVDELIFQEYGDREVRGSAVQRIIDACSTEGHDDLQDENRRKQSNGVEEIQTFENTYPLVFSVLWFSYFHIGCHTDWNVLYFCVLCCLSRHIGLPDSIEGIRTSKHPVVENHF